MKTIPKSISGFIKKLSTTEWVVFFVSLGVFALIMTIGVPTDLQVHIVRNSYPNPNPTVSSNFLYYWLIWITSFFVRSKVVLGGIFSVILALSVLYKYKVGKHLFPENIGLKNKGDMMNIWLLVSPVALLFVFSLPTSLDFHQYYLGQFPANIWHNSTTIAVMPFVVLAFITSYQYLENPENKVLVRLIVWSLLIYFIKPSFLPALIVVFPLFALVKFGIGKPFWSATAFSIGLLVLMIVPLLNVANGSNGRNEGGGLGLGLFNVWSLYSHNYLLSLVSSLLFPLICLIFYFKKILRDGMVVYSWICWLVCLLLFVFIYEKGAFMKAGNMGWQLVMATYLLFMVTLSFFNNEIRNRGLFDLRDKLIAGAFFLHFLSGLVYIVKMMFFGFE